MTTAAATRRSSRLSAASTSSHDDSASLVVPAASSTTATAKGPRRSTAASSRSSGASSAVIPTVAARTTKRSAATGKERRFEDVLEGPGDETRMHDLSLGAMVQAKGGSSRRAKGKANPSSKDPLDSDDDAGTKGGSRERTAGTLGASASARRARGPRKTFGEEADGDFFFKRDAPASSKAANGIAAAAMAPPTISASANRKRRAASPGSSKQASSSSSSSRTGSSRTMMGRTTYEPLPDEAAGETPIIRRNQAFRAGLEVHPGAGVRGASNSGRQSDGKRRSSLGLKGERRRSSLRDPAVAAYPHDDVPDHELFRHCPPDSTPQIRMRHLIGWALKRSLDAALGKSDTSATASAPDLLKGKRRKADTPLPSLTDTEKSELQGREESLTRIFEQLLSDLHCGAFGINWMGENDHASSASQLQPHPRNVSNVEAKSRLASSVENMTNESKSWQKELWQIDSYEADTEELERQVAVAEDMPARPVGEVSADITDLPEVEWNVEEDLDSSGQQQLDDAKQALAWVDRFALSKPSGPSGPNSNPAPTKGKGRGRTSKAAAAAAEAVLEAEAEEALGDELDPRWKDVEFNVDLLRTRSHQFAQLELLASRYVRTVSAQNAQALRERTSASSSYANAATRSKRSGRPISGRGQLADDSGGDEEASAEGGAERLENLLSGIRESRLEAARASGLVSTNTAKRRTGKAEDTTEIETEIERFAPDESDAMDLLRALAKS